MRGCERHIPFPNRIASELSHYSLAQQQWVVMKMALTSVEAPTRDADRTWLPNFIGVDRDALLFSGEWVKQI